MAKSNKVSHEYIANFPFSTHPPSWIEISSVILIHFVTTQPLYHLLLTVMVHWLCKGEKSFCSLAILLFAVVALFNHWLRNQGQFKSVWYIFWNWSIIFQSVFSFISCMWYVVTTPKRPNAIKCLKNAFKVFKHWTYFPLLALIMCTVLRM